MPEPIAVAFVEIRPDTAAFQSEADAEVRSALGGDPIGVPAQLEVGGINEAKRELDAVFRNLEATADVSVQPDLATFRTDIDDAVLAAVGTRPVEIPGQLQLEGLEQAAADIRGLSTDLQRVADVSIAPGVEQLPQELAAANRSATQLASAINSVPVIPDIGGAETADQLGAADSAAAEFGTTLNDAATAASGVVDVLNLARNSTLSAALAQQNLSQAATSDADALLDAAGAADELTRSKDGLVLVSENLHRFLDLEADSAKRLSAALRDLNAADERITARRASLLHGPAAATAGNRPTEDDAELNRLRREGAEAEERYQKALRETKFVGDSAVPTQRKLAAVTREDAAARKVDTAAIQQQTRAEERQGLLRARVARAPRIGPFRLAGLGLGVGTAVFAVAQAVGALGDALTVTGDKAGTAEGQLRNFGASLLQADIVGAFKALTDNTQTYTTAQLRLITQTPALVSMLKAVGESANLARSASGALAGLQQPGQFLQTALAREQRQGDIEGQIATLQRIQDFYVRAKQVAQTVGGDQKEVNATLEVIEQGLKSTQDQLNQLTLGGAATGPRLATRITAAEAAGDLPLVGELLGRQAKGIRDEIGKVEKNRAEQDAAAKELKTLTGRVDGTKQAIQRETEDLARAARSRFLLGGAASRLLPVKPGAGPLDAVVKIMQAELVDLQEQRAQLQAKIADLKREGGNLGALKGQLADANRLIEENTQALLDEQQRHLQEMQEKSIQGLETARLQEEAFGTPAGQIRALQAEVLLLQAQLPIYKALGPAGVEIYQQTLALIIAKNNQIEALQDGITAEQERHTTELAASQDKEHQAFLNQLQNREQHLLNLLSRSQAAGQTGEKFQRRLIAFYLKQSRNQRLTADERRAFRDQFVSATNELKGIARDEVGAESDRLRAEIDAREDLLQDRLTLAELNEKSTRDDARALKRLIAFYRKQSKNQDLTVAERRKYLIKLRQTQKQLNDLAKEAADEGKNFAQLSFAFLQEQQGILANFGPNFFPPGALTVGGAGVTSSTAAIRPPRPPGVPSPFTTASNAAAAKASLEPRGITFGQANEIVASIRDMTREMRLLRRGAGHGKNKHSETYNKHLMDHNL